MTTLYTYDGITHVSFKANDNYPHVSEGKPGEPFHLFRAGKEDSYPSYPPESILVLLKGATDRFCQKGYTTDWPDIADYDYEKREFEGIKVSCFEVNGYFVAATILVPEAENGLI